MHYFTIISVICGGRQWRKVIDFERLCQMTQISVIGATSSSIAPQPRAAKYKEQGQRLASVFQLARNKG